MYASVRTVPEFWMVKLKSSRVTKQLLLNGNKQINLEAIRTSHLVKFIFFVYYFNSLVHDQLVGKELLQHRSCKNLLAVLLC